MLEYFTYKKAKKHQAAKKQAEGLKKEAETKRPTSSPNPAPILNEGDEDFLTRVISAEGTPPPLPDRPSWWGPTAGEYTENDLQMILHESARADYHDENVEPEGIKEKGIGKKARADTHEDVDPKATKKAHRFSFLHRKSSKDKNPLKPDPSLPADEATAEEAEIFRVLDELNLSAVNNKAISLSKESQALVQSFTFILKDLINGVPTAYDDLTHLLDDSQGTLAKSYDHLPKFLQKLITQLPNKMTSSLAPELLAVAAEAQAVNPATVEAAGGGIAGAAKAFLTVGSLKELVTKPGAVIRMLKYIMNALKLRWPAFMGTNVLLSLGLFVLLFVFWYCHKRGREVRLGKDNPAAANGSSTSIPPGERITTLEDDPMLPSSNENNPRPRSRRSEERNVLSSRRKSEDRNSHSRRTEDNRNTSRREQQSPPRKERDREREQEREREKEYAGNNGREKRK